MRRHGERTNQEDFEDALKNFYSTRTLSLASMSEIAASGLSRVPEWFRGLISSSSSS